MSQKSILFVAFLAAGLVCKQTESASAQADDFSANPEYEKGEKSKTSCRDVEIVRENGIATFSSLDILTTRINFARVTMSRGVF